MLTLHLRTGRYAVSQLPAGGGFPQWATSAQEFVSVTRREGEVSAVTVESAVPEGVKSQGGWRLLELDGPFEFSLTGILLSVLQPLAAAGVGVFAISTFDTDALLIQEGQLDRGLAALRAVGHRIR